MKQYANKPQNFVAPYTAFWELHLATQRMGMSDPAWEVVQEGAGAVQPP